MAAATMPLQASPAERDLLERLTNDADLLLPVSPGDLDELAAVGAVTEDLEDGADLEPDPEDWPAAGI